MLTLQTTSGAIAPHQSFDFDVSSAIRPSETSQQYLQGLGPVYSDAGRLDAQLMTPNLSDQSSPALNAIDLERDRVASQLSQVRTQNAHRSFLGNQQLQQGASSRSFGHQRPPAEMSSTQAVSPVVRIENYSKEDSTVQPFSAQGVRKASQGGKRSATHLSPFAADEATDDEDEQWGDGIQHSSQGVANASASAERNDDGSWRVDDRSGHAGIAPDVRDQINDVYVLTLEEQEQARKANEKKAEVEDWLSRSDVGSDAGDSSPRAATRRRKRTAGRPRAKSANDATGRLDLPWPHNAASTTGLGLDALYSDTRLPGPGAYIDELSQLDDDDDDDDDYDMYEGGEEAEQEWRPTSPAAEVGAITRIDTDDLEKPGRYQPSSSNAAMMRFYQRAKDVEAASLAATIGSRRKSDPELGSLWGAQGVLSNNEDGVSDKKEDKKDRRPSFFDSILPKRSNSNVLKRKSSQSKHPQHSQDSTKQAIDKLRELEKEKDIASLMPNQTNSWTRPKSPKIDTSVAIGSNEADSASTPITSPSGAWAQAKSAIRRSRSRSDIGKQRGLAALMTQHGGPPAPLLASPNPEAENPQNKLADQDDEGLEDAENVDDDDLEQDRVVMDLKVRSDPIVPTMEGFRTHARQLNPRLPDFMVERVTQEQIRRYKRLLELKKKHLAAVSNRNCPSDKYCIQLGGEAKPVSPKTGAKDGDAPAVGFQIMPPDGIHNEEDLPNDGAVVAAQFPSGVPLPPVKRLPAEFECPLCFKVKKFYKPSDWTKHVHEDVQPFTCTFPNCGEPKSFKRKADWVRHENERHRKLESWTCSVDGCAHICYRKDNFVQHLVREHKIPEPRGRAARAPNTTVTQYDHGQGWQGSYGVMTPTTRNPQNTVQRLVEECHHDTTKQPKDEPCRFCGNICNTWKKLTVHLAKHMEQVAMPVLGLVEQKHLSADTIISPVEAPKPRLKVDLSASEDKTTSSQGSPNRPLSASLSPYGAPPFGNASPHSALAASAMHTYPPPQMGSRPHSPYVQPVKYEQPVPGSSAYAVQSYPGFLTNTHGQNIPVHNGFLTSQGSAMSSAFLPSASETAPYNQQQLFASPVDGPFNDPFTALGYSSNLNVGMKSGPTATTERSRSPAQYGQPGTPQNGHASYQNFSYPQQQQPWQDQRQ